MNLSGLKPFQHEHAKQIARVLNRHGRVLDGSDTGTGKTFVALWAAREMGVSPLVLCPKAVAGNWQRAGSMLGVEVEAVGYEKVRGVRKKYLAKRDKRTELGEVLYGPFVERLSDSAYGEECKRGSGSFWKWAENYDMMIFDEVHRCGGMSSLTSKLLKAANRQAGAVVCLSATVADDPTQMSAVGQTLGLFTPKDFRNWLLKQGCTPGIFGGFDVPTDPVVKEDMMANIGREIYPAHGSRMVKALIPGFPKTQISAHLITDDTGKAEKLAREVAEAFTGQHLARRIALRQKLELLRVPHWLDLAEDYGRTSKVVIFANYTATIDLLLEKAAARFGRENVAVIDGRNPKERDAIGLRFQRNEILVLIVNSAAGGTGLNLEDPRGQVERTSLISPCDDPKIIKQIWGRVCRDGGAFSQQLMTYFADTLEAAIAEAVNSSINNIDALNDAIFHGAF